MCVLGLLRLFGERIEIRTLLLLWCRRRPWLGVRSAFLGRRFTWLGDLFRRILAIGDSKDKNCLPDGSISEAIEHILLIFVESTL